VVLEPVERVLDHVPCAAERGVVGVLRQAVALGGTQTPMQRVCQWARSLSVSYRRRLRPRDAGPRSAPRLGGSRRTGRARSAGGARSPSRPRRGGPWWSARPCCGRWPPQPRRVPLSRCGGTRCRRFASRKRQGCRCAAHPALPRAGYAASGASTRPSWPSGGTASSPPRQTARSTQARPRCGGPRSTTKHAPTNRRSPSRSCVCIYGSDRSPAGTRCHSPSSMRCSSTPRPPCDARNTMMAQVGHGAKPPRGHPRKLVPNPKPSAVAIRASANGTEDAGLPSADQE